MPRVQTLISQLLDKGYDQAIAPTLNSIARRAESGLIAQRLRELEAEAARLAAANERLTPDNAILRALTADLDGMMAANARDLNAAAQRVQTSGIEAASTLTRQLALPGMDDNALASIGINWNVPDPEAVNRLVSYTSSPGWQQELSDYGLSVPTKIREIALNGLVNGRGPLAIARDIREAASVMSLYRANSLARTLQLQSYRDATAIHQQANADILEGAIRIGVLDNRICLCCLALHGQRIGVGERVTGHHQCRCTAVGLVRGRQISVQTGQDWFAAQSAERQRQIAGPGAYDALRTGSARLDDFVQPYDDQVFGDMLREASLSQALTPRR